MAGVRWWRPIGPIPALAPWASRDRDAGDFPVARCDGRGIHEATIGADHAHAERREPRVGFISREVGEDCLRVFSHTRKIERGLRDRRAEQRRAPHAGNARRCRRKRMNLQRRRLRRAMAVFVADKDNMEPERRRRHGDPGRRMAAAEHA
jgi:hypothetical protein